MRAIAGPDLCDQVCMGAASERPGGSALRPRLLRLARLLLVSCRCVRCCDLLVLGEVYKGHGEVPAALTRPRTCSEPALGAGAAEAILRGTWSSDSPRFCRGFAAPPMVN